MEPSICEVYSNLNSIIDKIAENAYNIQGLPFNLNVILPKLKRKVTADLCSIQFTFSDLLEYSSYIFDLIMILYRVDYYHNMGTNKSFVHGGLKNEIVKVFNRIYEKIDHPDEYLQYLEDNNRIIINAFSKKTPDYTYACKKIIEFYSNLPTQHPVIRIEYLKNLESQLHDTYTLKTNLYEILTTREYSLVPVDNLVDLFARLTNHDIRYFKSMLKNTNKIDPTNDIDLLQLLQNYTNIRVIFFNGTMSRPDYISPLNLDPKKILYEKETDFRKPFGSLKSSISKTTRINDLNYNPKQINIYEGLDLETNRDPYKFIDTDAIVIKPTQSIFGSTDPFVSFAPDTIRNYAAVFVDHNLQMSIMKTNKLVFGEIQNVPNFNDFFPYIKTNSVTLPTVKNYYWDEISEKIKNRVPIIIPNNRIWVDRNIVRIQYVMPILLDIKQKVKGITSGVEKMPYLFKLNKKEESKENLSKTEFLALINYYIDNGGDAEILKKF